MKKFMFLLALSACSFQLAAQDTNNAVLAKVITRVADTIAGPVGNWQFVINERLFVCITDENHNRMRIMSPITELDNISEKELLNALVANFHTALDVKYAISDEVMWAVFIHPLKELSDEQIEDAISQVYYAGETFGSIYTSTNLSFPGNTRKKERKVDSPKLQKG